MQHYLRIKNMGFQNQSDFEPQPVPPEPIPDDPVEEGETYLIANFKLQRIDDDGNVLYTSNENISAFTYHKYRIFAIQEAPGGGDPFWGGPFGSEPSTDIDLYIYEYNNKLELITTHTLSNYANPSVEVGGNWYTLHLKNLMVNDNYFYFSTDIPSTLIPSGRAYGYDRNSNTFMYETSGVFLDSILVGNTPYYLVIHPFSLGMPARFNLLALDSDGSEIFKNSFNDNNFYGFMNNFQRRMYRSGDLLVIFAGRIISDEYYRSVAISDLSGNQIGFTSNGSEDSDIIGIAHHPNSSDIYLTHYDRSVNGLYDNSLDDIWLNSHTESNANFSRRYLIADMYSDSSVILNTSDVDNNIIRYNPDGSVKYHKKLESSETYTIESIRNIQVIK